MAKDLTKYDVLILGAGPAGMSAAMWCEELALTSILIECEPEPGGQLLWTHGPIRNYPGLAAENGREFRDRILEQLRERDINLVGGDCVKADLANRTLVMSDGDEFYGRAVIIATGVHRRRLHIPGEAEFAGRGVLESGQTAGELTGKHAVVVGGGDAAAENAIILSEKARNVTIVHRGPRLRAREEFLSVIATRRNISIKFGTRITAITGTATVSGVVVERAGTEESLPADAVLVRIGVEPNSDLFRGQINLNPDGYIDVDSNAVTSMAGIFAIGDVAAPTSPTIATAVGMGATAAKAILRLLNAK